MELGTAVTDSDLLSRYLHEGDESAFARLVRVHERMVVGTAWRHVGDAELARDVAQEVFATLAQKATLLAGRRSLAGWLHIAATHFASRLRSSERARRDRHERAAGPTESRTDLDVGHFLEESLASIGEAEREALVLHYFEDRSYAEMAQALGLQEAAARKRVSRALERLGAQLKRRGFGGSAIAALVGAGATQATLPATAIAATALTLPAGSFGSSFALTVMTIMGNTAVKIAAAVVLVSALPVIWQSQSNAAMRAEIAEARRPSPEQPVTAFDNTPQRAEFAALAARLTETRQKTEFTKARLADSQRELDRIQKEVLVKFGKTEDLARTVAAKLSAILPALVEMERKAPVDAAMQETLQKASETALELFPYLGQLRQMDDQPEQAGRFASTLLTELLKLPPETTPELDRLITENYVTLKRDGLTLGQRPKDGEEAWTARREAANKELTTKIIGALPPGTRSHPMLLMLSEGPGILLPVEAADFGNSSDGKASTDFLKANPSQPQTKPVKRP